MITATARRLRREVALVAISATVALGTTGCGGSSGSNDDTPGQITLTVQDYYTQPSSGVYDAIFKQYEQTHPNIKIKHVELPGPTYLTQVLQQAQSNTLPDVLMLDNPTLPQVADTGVLQPLSDIGNIDLSQFIDSAKQMITYKGAVYAVPIVTTTVALFYNKATFSKAGLQPPRTWQELLTTAKRLSGGGNYGIGVTADTSDGGDAPWQFLPFAWSNGGSLADASSPEMKEALQLWVDLVNEGAMSKSVVNWGAQDLVDQFSAGKLPMMVNGAWNFPALDAVGGLDYGVVPLPVKDSSHKASGAFGGEVWSIPKSTPSDRQKAALDLLAYLSNADNSVNIAVKSYAVPLVQSGIPKAVQQIGPNLQPFVDELENGRQRTESVGAHLPQAARILTNAIQSALTGTRTVDDALNDAAQQIKPLLISQ
ncbi:sugar ABC transporter substrate-binding protein [Planotetraspora silvatica]|uniref:Sugar ABC transporter substrate-binding protein n=1 Tax=Planotetraspora silvatica TaxID=234614 RepID=A0A8J3XML7_9ACTN|nr:sugar ABC transporter substrate-binding protein [Planotetraspora silvatica]GII47572.1 sugar ABC transporter substrate-binding protein [Planotetraspora silvatica]